MASSVRGDHRGPPLHSSACVVRLGGLRICALVFDGTTTVSLATNYKLSFLFSRRLAKEEVAYITEAKKQEERIERLKAEAGDEYVIKKQARGPPMSRFPTYLLRDS